MATTTISWGDGTTDTITVTYTGAIGGSTISVSSSPNKNATKRTKTLTFKSSGGIVLGTLVVEQNAQSRAYSIAFSKGYK